ncbi:MAG: alkaline phosphatase family protein [Chloroflexi bacterium]|nr:alkaline phosphatase family protein [Chloroflexota bacterium]
MKTIILGLDAFDAKVFEEMRHQGKLPALTRLAQQGDYARFEVSNPPQSEVSWTSIATGLSPAGHGMFDFVHRNPENYNLYVSLLPTKQSRLGTEFVRPHNSHTIFDEAIEQGYPATALWWPATFPARLDSPIRNIPGLGTPDIHGRLGVGVGFAFDLDSPKENQKIPIQKLSAKGKNEFTGDLAGPSRQKSTQEQKSSIGFRLSFLDANCARLSIGNKTIELEQGSWSPIIELKFKMGLMVSVSAITRVILTHGLPSPRLYFLPLQLHPLHSPWRYAAPRGFVKQAWGESGGFLSLGWSQDTTALEEGLISDDQFLDLCKQIFETRKYIFLRNLDRFKEGVLASVFDTLDRVQHMFWHDRPDIIEEWYIKLDHLVEQVTDIAGAKASPPHLLVVSDHGFANFDYKVHVNRWLEEHGYLVTTSTSSANNSLIDVDWTKSQAYAIGLNSLYLNLSGREGKGCVSQDEKDDLLINIQHELLQWKGPDGNTVFNTITPSNEAYEGPYAPYAPDLILGFSAGFRASAETGLGKWEISPIVENKDHWHADHCIDSQLVPGVIFSNRGFGEVSQPSYREFPEIAIGMTPKTKAVIKPPTLESEEQADIEERLKGLGYL